MNRSEVQERNSPILISRADFGETLLPVESYRLDPRGLSYARQFWRGPSSAVVFASVTFLEWRHGLRARGTLRRNGPVLAMVEITPRFRIIGLSCFRRLPGHELILFASQSYWTDDACPVQPPMEHAANERELCRSLLWKTSSPTGTS